MPHTATPSIVLVTPVWNDANRLAVFGEALAHALAAAELPIQWIIADDGSDPEDALRYTALRDRFGAIYPHLQLLPLPHRSRKGGAVYDAWAQAIEADCYAFVDADGAVSPETMIHLIRIAIEAGGTQAVLGVRPLGGNAAVKRSLIRKGAFFAFRSMVRLLVGAGFEDTQCGAKVIPGAAYRQIAASLGERGFIFDVELLVALQPAGVALIEIPIAWTEVSGSRIRLSGDSWEMLKGLWRIRRRQRAGHYHTKQQP